MLLADNMCVCEVFRNLPLQSESLVNLLEIQDIWTERDGIQFYPGSNSMPKQSIDLKVFLLMLEGSMINKCWSCERSRHRKNAVLSLGFFISSFYHCHCEPNGYHTIVSKILKYKCCRL